MNIGINNRATPINQIFVGVNNVAKLVYQAGGGSGSFELPTFTGSSSIFGDTTSGRIELYESGTLTLSPGTYDVFLVGGGASGGAEASHSTVGYSVGGGGSGYTATQKNVSITETTEANVIIGAGGTFTYAIPYKSSAGGSTSIQASTFGNSAEGGKNTCSNTSGYDSPAEGTDGGSGGGAGTNIGNQMGTTGGSNGGDGESSGGGVVRLTTGGVGQGTTTRAFGEDSGTLYAGGGGGGGSASNSSLTGSSAGGEGGGGTGGCYNTSSSGPKITSTAGTPNTGGGGGGGAIRSYSSTRPNNGGSGIVIVRWNNT